MMEKTEQKEFAGQDLYDLYLEYEKVTDVELDAWQQKILNVKGSTTLRSGRQVGKSFVIARRSVKFTSLYENTTRLVIAPAQRQSSQIFEKMLQILTQMHQLALDRVGGYKDNHKLSLRQNREARSLFESKYGIFTKLPTKTEICLKGGRKIYAFPAGKTGVYLRCYAIDFLDADEAAFIPEPVWVSVIPMLAVAEKTRGLGWQSLLSTPFGKGGYFYRSFHDTEFQQFHVSSENCKRISKAFLLKEKRKLSKVEYAQEWLGEFIDEFNQYFASDLIKERMNFINWDYSTDYNPNYKYFLGMDIARLGKDENAWVIIEMRRKNHLRAIYASVTEKKRTTDTTGRTLVLHERFKFNRIFIDDGGVGGGVTDQLIEKLGKSRIVGLDNARKRIYDEGEEKKKGILKHDLYSNALVLMEKGEIDIIANVALQGSLKCMTFQYTGDGNLKIYGKTSHLSEAFVRACWCTKSKGLNLFAV